MLLALLVTLFAVQIHSACIGSLSQPQYNSLETLFNSTSGESWVWSSSSSANSSHWTFPSSLSDPCSLSWQGLNCSEISPGACNVQGLDLTGMNLQGSLPVSSFIDLTAMVSLSLGHNLISGTLPTSLGYLTQLQIISFDFNLFVGSIPTEIGQLTNIQQLVLADNKLTGEIPTQLGRLTSLSVVYIYNNSLVGSLPSEIGLLTQLTAMGFGSNYLTGSVPLELLNCTALSSFYMGGNLFTGTIPSEVSVYSQMEIYLLNNNFLTGSIPPSIATLTAMTGFSLDFNLLSGMLPPGLGNFSMAQYLTVDRNFFTGPVPSQYGKMGTLIDLALSNNRLSGTIPTEFGQLTALIALDLGINFLSGTIPTELGQLSLCTFFSIPASHLSGEIPTEIGKLTILQNLYLNNNPLLTGTIPSDVYSLTNLISINLLQCGLTGSVSSSIGNLVNLQSFQVGFNALTGHFPSEIGEMSSLTEIQLSFNMFSGMFPSQVGLLSGLLYLDLGVNNFSGTLPPEIGNMFALQQLSVLSNRFSGPLPDSFQQLSNMYALDLYSNLLSGSISPWLGNLTQLGTLSAQNNRFVGTFPTEVGRLLQLISLNFDNCELSGTLPTEITLLSHLEMISFASNHLTGTIPHNISMLHSLEFLELSENLMTGTLPFTRNKTLHLHVDHSLPVKLNVTSILDDVMENINIFHNFFTGTIPDDSWGPLLRSFNASANYLTGTLSRAICNSSLLQSLSVNSVDLTGTVPSCLASLRVLEQLDLSANRLHGDLGQVFGPTTYCPRLAVLDLSQNALTGTLPDFMFQQPRLNTLVLYSNCFHGSLPKAVCGGDNLTELVLDGLTSAAECLLPSIPLMQGVFPKVLMSGSIPECVWSMPKLSLLHLAGNGFTGTLGELSSSSVLSDVNLASNRLVGTLPSSFQHYGGFVQLDVSSNRITGTLSSSFAVSPQQTLLNLTVNRLSGPLPASLQYAEGVNILDGNVYSCNSALPVSDPDADEYVCGSYEFNVSLLIWVCGVTACVVVPGLYWHFCVRGASKSQDNDVDTTALLSCLMDDPYYSSLHRIKVCITVLSVIFCVVVMTVFAVMKSGPWKTLYSTQSFQYLWLVTSSFCHGSLPPIVIGLALGGSVLLVDVLLRGRSPITIDVDHCPLKTWRTFLLETSVYTLLHVFNIVVILVVNVAYVYAIIRGIPTYSLVATQAGLGCFKVFWNSVAVPMLVSVMPSRENAISHRSFMVLFGYIGGPFVSTFFSESTCFLYAVTGQHSVQSTFQLASFSCNYRSNVVCNEGDSSECEIHSFLICKLLVTTTAQLTSLLPGWMYSYRCSSSLLVDYVPVLLFALLAAGVVVPLLRVSVFFIPHRFRESGEFIFHRVGINALVTLSIAPPPSGDTTDLHSSRTIRIKVNGTTVTCRQILNLTTLLTFGLSCPLLGLAVAFDSIIQTELVGVVLRWSLQEVVAAMQQQQQQQAEQGSVNEVRMFEGQSSSPVAASQLRFEISAVNAVSEANRAREMNVALSLVMIFVGVYWSIFFLDMVGDVWGSLAGGLCMLIPSVGCPLMFWLLGSQDVTFHALEHKLTNSLSSLSFGTEMVTSKSQAVSTTTTTTTNPVFDPQSSRETFSFEA